MTVDPIGNGIYIGTSSDTKPTTGVITGAIFLENNTGFVYYYNGSAWTVGATAGGGGAGEANTYSTSGTGLAWTQTKSGVNLPFRSLIAGSTKLSATQNTNDITIDVNQANLSIAYSQLTSVPSTFAPSAHASSHNSAGGDVVHVDTIGSGTDITTNNASTTKHGLLKKLSNAATEYMDGTGNWSIPAGGGGGSGAAGTYTYYLYKESSTYYLQGGPGTAGSLTSNADFVTLLQGVIDGISPAGTPTHIKLGAGDFVVSNFLTIPSSRVGNITIEGLGMGITNLKISGTLGNTSTTTTAIIIGDALTVASGNTGTLTANAAVKTRTLTMSTGDVAKFAQNDLVLIRSTANFVSPATATSEAKQGEIRRVFSASGTTLTVDTPIVDSYTTANTAVVIKLDNILKNITISNLTITKHSDLADNIGELSASIKKLNFVHFKYVNGLSLESVQLMDNIAQYDSGIVLYSCVNVTANNMYFIQNPSNSYNYQYGIAVKACCENVIVSNSKAFGRFRHAFEMAGGVSAPANYEGVPRNITCADCIAYGGEVAPFDTHADGEFLTFFNCQVLGTWTEMGFYVRSRRSKIVGCSVHTPSTIGIYLDENAHDAQIIGCTVQNAGFYSLRIKSVTNVTVIGGAYNAGFDWSVYVHANSDYLTMSNVTLKDGLYGGLYALDTDNININNCVIANNTNFGIYIDASARTLNKIRIVDNDFTGQVNSKLTLATNVTGDSIVERNFNYNPIGAITTAFPASAGSIRNTSSTNAAPTSNTTYTNRFTRKRINITSGTVSSISINGGASMGTSGSFVLGIGETINVTHSVAPTVVVRAE